MRKKPKMPSSFGGYCTDSEFQEMDYGKFQAWAGGYLAVALFEGKFNSSLAMIIRMAEARGQKYQWEQVNRPNES